MAKKKTPRIVSPGKSCPRSLPVKTKIRTPGGRVTEFCFTRKLKRRKK